MDAATLTGLTAGIGWVAKKVVKENFTCNPSSSAMSYVKFTAVMAWVKRLPEVVAALNNEVTWLIGMKPAVAIKEKDVAANPSTPYSRPVGQREKKLPSIVNVRYLYQPGELEGGVKRATDPIWSLKVYNIERSFTKPNQPVLYYLHDGPERGFVREELLVVPQNTTLPPADVN